MEAKVQKIWLTISEPRVLTACAVAVYIFSFGLGLYITTTHASVAVGSDDRWVALFWVMSGVLMLSFTPLAIVGAWRGMWMVERPALLAVALGIILASSISFFTHFNDGPAGAMHLATIVLAVAVLITRWNRITTSFADPVKPTIP